MMPKNNNNVQFDWQKELIFLTKIIIIIIIMIIMIIMIICLMIVNEYVPVNV